MATNRCARVCDSCRLSFMIAKKLLVSSVCILSVPCIFQNWLERAMCFYPPDLATDDNLPPHLVAMLDRNGMMLVTVFIEHMQVCQLPLLMW